MLIEKCERTICCCHGYPFSLYENQRQRGKVGSRTRTVCSRRGLKACFAWSIQPMGAYPDEVMPSALAALLPAWFSMGGWEEMRFLELASSPATSCWLPDAGSGSAGVPEAGDLSEVASHPFLQVPEFFAAVRTGSPGQGSLLRAESDCLQSHPQPYPPPPPPTPRGFSPAVCPLWVSLCPPPSRETVWCPRCKNRRSAFFCCCCLHWGLNLHACHYMLDLS